MRKDDVILIKKVWVRLAGEPFAPQEFVKKVHWYGGIDMSRLSPEDLLQLLEGRFSGDWHKPAFAFSELLALYSVPEESRSKEEIVGWIFASFVIRDAITRDESEWQMQFNHVVNGFLEVRKELEIGEAVEVFQRLFEAAKALEKPIRTAMTEEDLLFIERLWERLTGRKFVPQEFAKEMHRHGGIDMSNLSHEDLLQLLEGRFAGDWSEPAFSFSELLAFYSVPNAKRGQSRTKEEVVGWVFASFVIADAIKQGGTDWEMQFNLFMNGFLEVRSELEIDEAIEIFQRVFHRDAVLEQSSGA